MIELKNVTKVYHGAAKSSRSPDGGVARAKPIAALDRLNLTIPTGGFAFVVGPSGAGKTTLSRLITREERATAGRVLVDGFDIGTLTDAQLPFYRRQLGIIFQDFRLFPRMTAGENVAFASLAVGVPAAVARRRARALLSQVGIGDKHDCLPAELSGGECQRVAIARALANHPKIIIADEPTGNLDPALSLEIIRLLQSINRATRATVLIITHDLATVAAFREPVVRLVKGRLAHEIIHNS